MSLLIKSGVNGIRDVRPLTKSISVVHSTRILDTTKQRDSGRMRLVLPLSSERDNSSTTEAQKPEQRRVQASDLDQTPPASGVATGQPAWRLVLLAVLLSGAVIIAISGAGTSLLETVQELADGDVSWLGAAAFVFVYALATVLLFPASVLTLVAGALFGPLKGTLLVSVASTLGACLAFLSSRYLVRPLVEERLLQYPKLKAVVDGISSQGLKVVFLLRLSPLFPFNLLNYALGITSIKFWEYAAASWSGMLPATFAYVFLGGAGRVAADAATSGAALQPAQLLLYGVGAVATLAVTKVAADAASRALQEQQQNED